MTGLGISGLIAVFALVGIGSAVPILPTGAVVSAAALVASHDTPIEVILVVAFGALGAYVGDVVTYVALRWAGAPLAQRVGWIKADDPDGAIQQLRSKLERNEVRALLLSRLIPGGRIPVLLAAALGGYSVVRFASANVAAVSLWATAYAAIGISGRSLFPNPTTALIVVVVGAVAVSAAPLLIRRLKGDDKSVGRST